MAIGRHECKTASNTHLKEAIAAGLDEALTALEECFFDLTDEQAWAFPIPGRNNVAWIVMHWRDLTVANAPQVRDFYRALVGWDSRGEDLGDYEDYVMVAPTTGQSIAGICHARRCPAVVGRGRAPGGRGTESQRRERFGEPTWLRARLSALLPGIERNAREFAAVEVGDSVESCRAPAFCLWTICLLLTANDSHSLMTRNAARSVCWTLETRS